MDWFPYDRDLRHERVKKALTKFLHYGVLYEITDLLLFQLTTAPKNLVLMHIHLHKKGNKKQLKSSG